MNIRQSTSDVLAGLETTADKIRALARAGYLRTEIRDVLHIRYQHVRQVLVRSGIEDGMQRQSKKRSSPSVKAQIEKPKAKPIREREFLERGFRLAANWCADGEDGIELDEALPQQPAVYVIVVDGLVVYIGKASKNVRQRFYLYRKPGKRQKTNLRIKPKIRQAIDKGQTVSVLIATPEPTTWNGLPVNTVVGLEEGLVWRYQPPWNLMK